MSPAALSETQNRLAEEHLNLVAKIMRATHRSWRSLNEEDVVGAAFEGLASAVLTYNHNKNDSFTAWARSKIKWAILDFVRAELKHRVKTQPFQTETESGEVIEPFVRPVVKLVPKDTTPGRVPSAAVCHQCHHEYHFHHPRFGCMEWDRRRQGSGYCQCDGFQTRAPIA